MKNILSIIANPFENSLSHFIEQELTKKLPDLKFQTRDLYQLKFDPTLNLEDFQNKKESKQSKILKIEQNLILDSDLILFIYPMWWGGMPAIMKGYIDRVFSYGFAYKHENNKLVPGLDNTKSIFICSHGESEEKYKSTGMYESIENNFNLGLFDFSGLENKGFVYFHDTNTIQADVIQNKIETIKELILKNI